MVTLQGLKKLQNSTKLTYVPINVIPDYHRYRMEWREVRICIFEKLCIPNHKSLCKSIWEFAQLSNLSLTVLTNLVHIAESFNHHFDPYKILITIRNKPFLDAFLGSSKDNYYNCGGYQGYLKVYFSPCLHLGENSG